jgi:predicted heme/steroid binding protein
VREFAPDELAQYNGKHGATIYVAYGGQVYDVSRSYFWQNGRHQVEHRAGADLTGENVQAPHGPELIEKFPIVGRLFVKD